MAKMRVSEFAKELNIKSKDVLELLESAQGGYLSGQSMAEAMGVSEKQAEKDLQEMLDRAGYENVLIWTTIRHHYWTMVYVDGQWWHLDPTKFFPSHLMNDAQRIQRIRPGTNWDRTLFPASP